VRKATESLRQAGRKSNAQVEMMRMGIKPSTRSPNFTKLRANLASAQGAERRSGGIGRLGGGSKITAKNPSASSVGRIARHGEKSGALPAGTSTAGKKAYVKGFASGRAQRRDRLGRFA
jgi:hypothetical protein